MGQPRAVPAPKHVIPIEIYRDAAWLEVRVNGSKPLSFILDSGAGRSVVARDTAEKLGMEIVEQGEMSNIGPAEAKVQVAASPNVVFEMGGVAVTTHAMLLPFDVPSNGWGKRFDGAIGYELFAAWVVEVDFEKEQLRLYDPASYEYRGKGAVLPLRVQGKHPLTRARVGLPGMEPVEGDFMVDLGGVSSVVFTAPFVRKYDLLAAARKMVPRLMESPHAGVGGTGRRVDGRVQYVELGPYRVATPIAGFGQAESGALASDGYAGIIGCHLLHRFQVIFDYRRGQLIVEPNAHFADPQDEIDMSGMGLHARGENYGEIYVASLEPDSPAAGSGIRTGDVLVAVDGRPVAGTLVYRVIDLFKRTGVEHRVLVERPGGDRREFRFTTRRVL